MEYKNLKFVDLFTRYVFYPCYCDNTNKMQKYPNLKRHIDLTQIFHKHALGNNHSKQHSFLITACVGTYSTAKFSPISVLYLVFAQYVPYVYLLNKACCLQYQTLLRNDRRRATSRVTRPIIQSIHSINLFAYFLSIIIIIIILILF